MDNHTLEHLKTAGDAVSLGATLSALIGALPHVAAGLAIVWWLLRIYEQSLRIKRLQQEPKDE